MSEGREALAAAIDERFGDAVTRVPSTCGEITFEVEKERLLEVATALRDEDDFAFDTLMDVCGVDYLDYGHAEWKTQDATDSGFSRGVDRAPVIIDDAESFEPERFAVVYHLLSVAKNRRLRLRVYCGTDNPPRMPSVIGIWASADWFEREAFDLFGILFDGHPDLRRILTDYGFIGHPFRKDFPLSGNVEVRYDPEKRRVAYQSVTIEPRTLVPKVIRDDHRYEEQLRGTSSDG
ncbi:NADH-quinone oxidoreductase subunit C [Lentisalinibacter sediminis]|uniref:NADH-quinone oxidoreductase subunit C n=1 Tax=Lentisalinibacter sediminis TaxID=2992237 RepID=UPI00386A7292